MASSIFVQVKSASTNGKLVVWGLAVWIFGITENERDWDS